MIHGLLLSSFGRNLIGGAVLVLAVGGGLWALHAYVYRSGVQDCDQRHAVALAETIQRAQEQARAIALQDAEIANAFETERDRIRTVYRNREIEVIKHVPTDCRTCAMSPSGLGLLNDALTNHQPAENDPAEPAGRVPNPKTPPKWQLPGSGGPLGGGFSKVL